jgi:hypothetical protein
VSWGVMTLTVAFLAMMISMKGEGGNVMLADRVSMGWGN